MSSAQTNEVREVTTDRFMAVLKDLEFTGNQQGTQFYTFINEYPVRFDATNLPLTGMVNMYLFQHHFPAAQYQELVKFVNEFNFNTFFTHAYVVKEDSGELVLSADAPFLCPKGMSDMQLRLAIEVALQAVLEFGKQVFEHFSLQPVTPPEAPQEGK
ncbi:YbjN domain-containing protein [Corynebacterium choanae]|uniref:Bacterial sensory transduction regulator n=1 Tax=Corynebacterium choanae TaxID=1862358 RepID=A0A3G6JBD7_9CORY|nr:YbjN domain-containing protein [Corynebacterium choanae]AZA14388.1 hypothetical protein CCHOA_10025 [Corynebacterium choanae]